MGGRVPAIRAVILLLRPLARFDVHGATSGLVRESGWQGPAGHRLWARRIRLARGPGVRGAGVGLGAVWCHTLRCVGGERESAGTGHTEACSPRPPCPYTRVCLQHHTPALQCQEWTDVSLLSVVICAVAMAQSFSASEQGGGVSLVRGARDASPNPRAPDSDGS